MIAPVIGYLAAACRHAGLPPQRVLVGKTREEAYRTSPAALIQPITGSLRRDGSRVVAGPPQARRRLYRGLARFRVELYARTPEERDHMLAGVLHYLWNTPLVVGDDPQAKLNDITLSFIDEEGILVGENAVALEVPVEIALYEDTPWVPITVEVEEMGFATEV